MSRGHESVCNSHVICLLSDAPDLEAALVGQRRAAGLCSKKKQAGSRVGQIPEVDLRSIPTLVVARVLHLVLPACCSSPLQFNSACWTDSSAELSTQSCLRLDRGTIALFSAFPRLVPASSLPLGSRRICRQQHHDAQEHARCQGPVVARWRPARPPHRCRPCR